MIVLDGGLTFEQLNLVDDNGSTQIQLGEQLLATVANVNVGLVTEDNFATLF